MISKKISLLAGLLAFGSFCSSLLALDATAPSLGVAQSFAVLGGSTVTNTGSSVLTGDLGVWPGLAISGFPPGTVTGTVHAGDAVALQAQSDLVTAYNQLAGQACDTDLTGQDLGGMTLTAGSYCFSTAAQLTGTLTLDAEGDMNAVFVFQIGSTLTTATDAVVQLINGASVCNVFWQVGSSATLGTNTSLAGSILALTSITLNTSATITGQALARNGAVTLDGSTVNVCLPVCPPIVVSPKGLPSGAQGVPYNEVISATGGTAPYTYTVTSGTLPSGAPAFTLDPNTGVLTGTPTITGTWVFTITATDAEGCTGVRVYSITINGAGCPEVTMLPSTLPNAQLNTFYSQAITASGSSPDTYIYTVSVGTLPPGLGLNPVTPPATQTVNLTGSPSVTGKFNFTITATDENGCQVSTSYSILVNQGACPAVTVHPATLPNPIVGVPYVQAISATGGAAPYTYTVTAGELPPPFMLNPSTGVLSGTATTTGNYSFTITATDANGCPGLQDYTLMLMGSVPTLSEWGLIALITLMALAGLVLLRRATTAGR